VTLEVASVNLNSADEANGDGIHTHEVDRHTGKDSIDSGPSQKNSGVHPSDGVTLDLLAQREFANEAMSEPARGGGRPTARQRTTYLSTARSEISAYF